MVTRGLSEQGKHLEDWIDSNANVFALSEALCDSDYLDPAESLGHPLAS